MCPLRVFSFAIGAGRQDGIEGDIGLIPSGTHGYSEQR